MGQKTELFKNTIIIAFGKLASQFIGFLLLPLYTNFLAPNEYGTVDLIITYVALLAPLLMIQLDRAAFRYLIDARGDKSKITQVISTTFALVVPSLAAALALFVMATFVVDVPFAGIIAAAIIATVFSNLLMQIARGFGQNVHYAIASVLVGSTTLILTLWLVMYLQQGVAGVLWSIVAANAVAAAYLFLALKLPQYISIGQVNKSDRQDLLSFSWPLVPSAISWWFIRASDRTIVSIILGVAANGVYAAASKYAMMFQALYTIFDLSWSESASAHINSPNRDKFFSEVYNASFRLFGAMGLGLIATTPFVFNIIIGDQFQEAYLYIPILIIGVLLQIYVALYSVVYIAKKATKPVLITSIIAGIISLSLNLVFINFIGLYAAAGSSAVAFLVMAIWRHYDIKKYVNVTFEGGIFVKLVGLYALIVTFYYINNLYVNIVSFALAAMVALLWSRSIVEPMLSKVLGKASLLRSQKF